MTDRPRGSCAHVGLGRQRLPSADDERPIVRHMIAVAVAHSARLAYNRAEAAELLGVSVEFFERYVAPEIRCVRRGRRRMFPFGELLFWLWRAAEDHAANDQSIEQSSK